MSLLPEVAAYVEANSTAFTLGGSTGSLHISIMTDAMPDTVTVLYDAPGVATAHTFSTGTVGKAYEQPGLQVLARSTSYATAKGNADVVYTMLDGLSNTTMTGVRYLSIDADQPPFPIGRDDNERHLVSCNFSIKRATT